MTRLIAFVACLWCTVASAMTCDTFASLRHGILALSDHSIYGVKVSERWTDLGGDRYRFQSAEGYEIIIQAQTNSGSLTVDIQYADKSGRPRTFRRLVGGEILVDVFHYAIDEAAGVTATQTFGGIRVTTTPEALKNYKGALAIINGEAGGVPKPVAVKFRELVAKINSEIEIKEKEQTLVQQREELRVWFLGKVGSLSERRMQPGDLADLAMKLNLSKEATFDLYKDYFSSSFTEMAKMFDFLDRSFSADKVVEQMAPVLMGLAAEMKVKPSSLTRDFEEFYVANARQVNDQLGGRGSVRFLWYGHVTTLKGYLLFALRNADAARAMWDKFAQQIYSRETSDVAMREVEGAYAKINKWIEPWSPEGQQSIADFKQAMAAASNAAQSRAKARDSDPGTVISEWTTYTSGGWACENLLMADGRILWRQMRNFWGSLGGSYELVGFDEAQAARHRDALR